MTDAQADEIRRAYAAREGGYVTLGRRFGVKANTVRYIILGRIFNRDGRVSRKPFANAEKESRWLARQKEGSIE